MQFEQRLTEDVHMMANFSRPLQCAIDYENDENNAHFTAKMGDIQERYMSILKGLSNITGELVSSEMAMTFDTPATTLSPNAFTDPVSIYNKVYTHF